MFIPSSPINIASQLMTPSPNVKLLGTATSPYSDRVRMALSFKSIDFEFIIVDLKNKSEFLLQSNSVYERIPVLIHEGKPISESLVINEYLDATWTDGPALMPADPYDCAIARFWAYYIDTTFFPRLRELAIFADGEEAISAARDQLVESTLLIEGAFVECSKGKPYFGGDNIGYLDIAFGSQLSWTLAAEILTEVKVFNETKMPGLIGWIDKFRAHDAVKDIPEKLEAFIESGKGMRAKLKASKS